MSEIIKSKSKMMSWGGSKANTYTGFPLKFFEELTYIERACEWFSTAPHYLDSALLKTNTDPVFRM